MSERTGVNFVMGCGWYREPYYPPSDLIDQRPVDDLAREIILEINQGVGDTGIRPGIIGEVGTDKSWVSAQEERVHRAAARAHLATGLPLTTHSIGKPVGLTELAIFEDEGVDPQRVIIGHCDHPFSLFIDYHLEILKRGAIVQFDTIGSKLPQLDQRALRILLDLLDRGYADQLLLSHDVCKMQQLRCLGGNGFAYVLGTFLPMLRQAGVPEVLITKMMVENPKRLLTVKKNVAPAGKTTPSTAASRITSRALGPMHSTHRKNPPAGLANRTYCPQCSVSDLLSASHFST